MKPWERVLSQRDADDGVNLIEAALLLLLIVAAAVVVLAWVGNQNGQLWDQVPQAFDGSVVTTVPADDGGGSSGGSSGGGGGGGGGGSGGGGSGGDGSGGTGDVDCEADPTNPECEEEPAP